MKNQEGTLLLFVDYITIPYVIYFLNYLYSLNEFCAVVWDVEHTETVTDPLTNETSITTSIIFKPSSSGSDEPISSISWLHDCNILAVGMCSILFYFILFLKFISISFYIIVFEIYIIFFSNFNRLIYGIYILGTSLSFVRLYDIRIKPNLTAAVIATNTTSTSTLQGGENIDSTSNSNVNNIQNTISSEILSIQAHVATRPRKIKG